MGLDKAAVHLMLDVLQGRVEAQRLLGHVLLVNQLVVTVVALLGRALSVLLFDLSDLDSGSAKRLVKLLIGRE
jgi:hypothetical protein